jgi:putative glutamine amidotransferase
LLAHGADPTHAQHSTHDPTPGDRPRDRARTSPLGLLGHAGASASSRLRGRGLTPDPGSTADPSQLISLLDGLILAGGVDVDPATYGAAPHPTTDAPCVERDRFEIALTAAAVERDLPLLGICRGMQILNIALGGTLHQDIPELHGHDEHRRVLGSFTGAEHDVDLESGSVAAQAAGETRHRTVSHHHQGVASLGDGLVVSGTSDFDPVPEAIEMPGCTFVLGVQWHPEVDRESGLIAGFVGAAADAAAKRL